MGKLLGVAVALCVAAMLLFALGADDNRVDGEKFVLLPGGGAPDGTQPTAHPTGGLPNAGRRFAETLAVVPRAVSLPDAGYVISNRSDPAVLAEQRLRVGDVLLTMDGRPLDDARLRNLANELAEFDAVEISYERSGQVRNRLLTFDSAS